MIATRKRLGQFFTPADVAAAFVRWVVDRPRSGIVTTTGGFIGFSPDLFNFDTSGFQNSLNGTFPVIQNGTDLDLRYIVIPKPGVGLLGGLGLFLLLRPRRWE